MSTRGRTAGGERELDEDAPPGTDFLSRLCTEWEAQALRAQAIGPDAVRVVLLRTAVVLDDRGGALPQMARPFRLGVGGRIGSGRQWMSWIHWRDLVGLIDHAIEDADISGPLNAASPQPMRNADFARAMGRSIGRPSWLPAPKFALRIALGEVAGALTNSQRVIPAKALDSGYVFLYPGLEQALQSLLGRDDDRGKASFFNSKDLHPGPAVLKTSAPAEPVNELPLPFVPARPVQLVAIDVDGTLLNTDGSIPQGVIHACRAAERAGCKIMLATARAPRALRTILQALDIPGPSINYNGAVIWDHERNAALFHEAVPAALARRIINDVQAMAPELIIGLDVLDRWHVTRVDPLFAMTNDPEYQPDSVGSLEPYLGDPVTKISLMGTPDQLLPVREMIRERYWQLRHVAVFLPDPRLVQITHPLVDKGIALQRVARQMGLSREEVMAIGDASNDMGMIEWAGVGVAVENAYPAVRQLADVIVPSNDELGVARAIQRYVLAGRR